MSKYKGQLEGFPDEVVEKMCYYQVQQGNPRDVSVFEEYVYISKSGGGFNWSDTSEGRDLWSKVIGGDFDSFFERYPKIESASSVDWKPYPKEKVMEVSNNGKEWHQTVVIGEKNGKYLAWCDSKTIEEANDSYYVFYWKYAREVKVEANYFVDEIKSDINKIIEKLEKYNS